MGAIYIILIIYICITLKSNVTHGSQLVVCERMQAVRF